MALKYDTSNLSDAVGTSSWYTGNFNADWNKWKNLMLIKYDTTTTTPTGAIVSGGPVSIIAKTLNVNGLIQSGFNNYVGAVDPKVAANIQRYGKRTLDDDAVIDYYQFKINNTDAETIYNTQTGMYDKVIELYLNPQTENILTDPIQPSGGVIYLKAQDIISTGNGKIIAAGGDADINSDTKKSSQNLIIKDVNTIKPRHVHND